MADILLTKAKDIDLTEGCRDCGGCEMGNTGGASKSRSVFFFTLETPNKGLLNIFRNGSNKGLIGKNLIENVTFRALLWSAKVIFSSLFSCFE